jgi:hypothetical protein
MSQDNGLRRQIDASAFELTIGVQLLEKTKLSIYCTLEANAQPGLKMN